MASSALEAKINKIRQQNEEIRRRYEEVEEDKKNAAKLNALVQMVPSSDWPERKEPPEFSNPPKAKQKPAKEKYEYMPQSYPVEGKKIHSFAQGEGPPPDPKYNFLADSEREEPSVEYTKETSGNRSHNKITRGNFRKKIGGRESIQKDNKVYKGNYRDESQPGYDAWRAERNRIDEDRISRQRTAEGNWRREWDNDKIHIIDDVTKKTARPTLADFTKKDYKDPDRRYYANNNEHANHNRGGNRPYRGSSKNFYGNYENRSHNTYDQHRNNAAIPTKAPLSPASEERTVIATDKSIKVTVNQGSITKGPVMSVKVNSPSIVGTGRVGPRQRSRVTYSHSDAEAPMSEGEPFLRQKSFEDKSKGSYFNNQKSPNVKRSQSLKKKEGESKYPYYQRKEARREDSDTNIQRHHESEFRSYAQKDLQRSYSLRSPKPMRNVKATKQDSSSEIASGKRETQECSNDVSTKLESNIVTESSETLEIPKPALPSDQSETSNIESGELNVKKETTNEITTEKETEETSLTSVSGTENPVEVTKDDVNINSFENKSDCSQELANNVTEDLQEGSNMSSEASVPSNVESKEEPEPTKSNNVSDGTVKLEEAVSSKDNQQSLEQVSEQFANDDCDNIKDEVIEQRSISVTTDVAASSLEVETHSVIDVKNQLVCNNESAVEETPIAGEKTNESNECSDKNLKDGENCSEVNVGNAVNGVSVDGNSMEENKEKTEETKDTKEEL